MKFGDKLVELRKKNGYSQEELAEKLGVSRQSVSKWESNNTYPETDKIIQIANLFDCSMDDLINDKITDVELSLRKNKSNIYNVWDSLLEFITKTVNMFSKMKFVEGLKCVIEIIILGFILSVVGKILCGMASSIIANIFIFFRPSIVSTIRAVLNGIFYFIWFIITIIIIVYTFKIRYLNCYDKDNEVKSEDLKKNDNSLNDKNKLEKKVVTRDEKPFEFLGVLSKIVIIFFKFISICIVIGLFFSTIGLIVVCTVLLYHVSANMIFLWLSLLFISASIVSIQLIILLISFIFNRKVNVKINIIIFISCIILSGIGVGFTAIGIKNLDFVDDNSLFNLQRKELSFKYKDNLVIYNNGLGETNKYKYIIDNSIDDDIIFVSKEIDPKYFDLYKYNTSIDSMPVVNVQQDFNNSFNVFYKFYIDNLKNNRLVVFYNYGNDPLYVKANENTINKLIENLEKLYLIDKKINNNQIDINIYTDKVFFKNGLDGEYNAIDDSIKYDDDDYSCTKEIEKTEYGDKFIYNCKYFEED